MPNYTFKDTTTDEEWTEMMTMSEREEFLKKNPHVDQVLYPTALVDPTRVGIKGVNNKPDSAFRDLLKDMKKKHRGSTINTN